MARTKIRPKCDNGKHSRIHLFRYTNNFKHNCKIAQAQTKREKKSPIYVYETDCMHNIFTWCSIIAIKMQEQRGKLVDTHTQDHINNNNEHKIMMQQLSWTSLICLHLEITENATECTTKQWPKSKFYINIHEGKMMCFFEEDWTTSWLHLAPREPFKCIFKW